MRSNAPLLVHRTDGGKPKAPRDYARELAAFGVADLAHALNYSGDPALPYRYSRSVLDRFKRLAMDLVELVEDGRIVELPHVNARNDCEFQAFLSATLVPAKKPQRQRRSPT